MRKRRYRAKISKRKLLRKQNYYRSIKMHLLRQTNICGICGKEIKTLREVTIDHIVPRSRGGPDALRNLQLAHFECNKKKANRLPTEL